MVDLRAAGPGQTGPQVSVGVLTADLTRLAEEISILHANGCWAHVDVMDGVFCPQLTVGAPVVAAAAPDDSRMAAAPS
jgi:pentose-5-phosphate-3-epimerase